MPSLRPIYMISLGLVVGCAGVPPWQPPEGHPANPAVVRAPAPQQSRALKRYDAVFGPHPEAGQPPKSAEHDHAGHTAAHPGGDLFTCPMHPEVVQSGPGQCPICQMQLVPKKNGGEGE